MAAAQFITGTDRSVASSETLVVLRLPRERVDSAFLGCARLPTGWWRGGGDGRNVRPSSLGFCAQASEQFLRWMTIGGPALLLLETADRTASVCTDDAVWSAWVKTMVP